MAEGEAVMIVRRRAGIVMVTGLIVLGLSGCMSIPFGACPAIGWLNTLAVRLDGDTTAVDQLQLCTDASCAPAGDVDMTGPLGLITVADHDGDTWTFSVDSLPETFTVRALAADGTVLSDTEVTPGWVRTGGSEQCGGPHEAAVNVQP